MARESMALHGMEWHGMRHKKAEKERGCWKGISGWALTLGLFELEKERALSFLCRIYTQRAKGGLRHPPPYSARLHSPSERQGRFRDVHVYRALRKPFDVPLVFEGTAERLEDFRMWCQEQQARRQLCARGDGSAQESKMDGEERKIANQSRGPTQSELVHVFKWIDLGGGHRQNIHTSKTSAISRSVYQKTFT